MKRPHITLTDRFMGMFHAGLLAKAFHRDLSEETPPGAIIEDGEFAGPIDGWLPTHTWLAKHGGAGEADCG